MGLLYVPTKIACWIVISNDEGEIWSFIVSLCKDSFSNINFTLDLLKNIQKMLGMVAHFCNPSTLGGWGGCIKRLRDQDHPGQHDETLSLLKYKKISWAWWHLPVIPATQEAEVGELPEPRRHKLRWAKIVSLHSSLGNKSETLSQKKKDTTFL